MNTNSEKSWTYSILTAILALLVFPILSFASSLQAAQETLHKDPKKALEILIQLEKSPASKETPSLLGDIYFQMAKTYKALDEFNNANEYCHKAIKEYYKIDNFQEVVKARRWMGQYLMNSGKSNEAVRLIEETIGESLERKDTSALISSKITHFGFHYDLSNFSETIKIAYEVLELMELHEVDKTNKVEVYNILGNINTLNKEPEKAIEHYEKAQAIATEIGDFNKVSFLKLNIGLLYSQENNIQLAEKYFFESLESSKITQNERNIAFSNLMIGELLVEKDSVLRQAQSHLNQAIAYFSKEKQNGYYCFASGLLGASEIRLGNFNKGLMLFDRVEKLIPQNSSTRDNRDILELIAEECYKVNLYERAYKYQKLKETFDKEIYDEKSNNEVLRLQTEFESKEKELEITTLKQQNLNQAVIGILLFVLVSALVFFIHLLWKQRSLLKVKNEALEKARNEAEKLASSKTEFLATMSHEIRTPMNGVIGMANILSEENPRLDQKENLEILKFSADNLLNLINDILDLAKIESGNIELEKTEFNIEDYCKKAFSAYKNGKKKANVKLALYTNFEGLNHQVIGDQIRLNQVVTNLVNNAMKFTEKGTVDVKMYATEVTKTNARIKFEIIDTGIGISKEKQKTIFEKYKQAETDTARLYGGTGLGLNIAKEIVELYGSHLKLESEPGKGSNFYFEIDFPLSKSSLKDAANTVNIEKNISGLSGMRVLLAEDNKVNQLVARRILTNWGIHLTIAQDGQQAIESLQKGDFDLILMDIQMPKLNGYEATDIIRKMPNPKGNVPIIAMTASSLAVLEKSKTHNMNGYIGKPFNPKELFKVISEFKKSNSSLAIS